MSNTMRYVLRRKYLGKPSRLERHISQSITIHYKPYQTTLFIFDLYKDVPHPPKQNCDVPYRFPG